MPQVTAAVLAAPEQAPGSAAGATVTVLVVVVLGFLLYRAIDKRQAKWPHLIMAFAMGVLLAGSLFGTAIKQVSNSLGTAMVQMLTTVSGTG